MGSTAVDNFEIYSDSANSIVIDRSPGALKLQTSLLSVRDEADTTQTISDSAAGAVESVSSTHMTLPTKRIV